MAGKTLTREAPSVTVWLRINPVTSSPSSRTRFSSPPLSRRMVVSAASRLQAFAVVQRQSGPQRLEGKGPVHCAGLQVQETEMTGQMPGDGTLARARWPVNRDNDLRSSTVAGEPGTHPRFLVPCFGRAVKP